MVQDTSGCPVVSVAKRVSLVPSPDSLEFKILQQGNQLVIQNQATTAQAWALGPPEQTARDNYSTILTVLDTGKLVLTSDGSTAGAADDDVVLRQRFDEPNDTWLPGQKIGWNGWREPKAVISWRNPSDPSPGCYYFGLDPDDTDQLVQMWNNSVVYWSSGEWDGQIFIQVPEMTKNAVFNYVYNRAEKTLSYYLRDTSILTRFVAERSPAGEAVCVAEQELGVDVGVAATDGAVRYLFLLLGICNQAGADVSNCRCLPGYEPRSGEEWNANNDCTSGCRPSSTVAGCSSWVCGGGKGGGGGGKERFLVMPNVRPPLNPVSPRAKANNTAECKSACLKDCSCAAYTYDGNSCRGCSSISSLKHLSPPVEEEEQRVQGVHGLRVSPTVRIRHPTASHEQLHRTVGGRRVRLFKGSLPPSANSTAIAVKKLERLGQGENQFKTEVSTVGTVQHVNIVKLLRYCSQGEHRLLVYEYLPNGSLDKYLFRIGGDDEESPTATLDWKTRYQVTLGVARGLVYLHDKCIECIVHCDIKPESILLDAGFCPKVSDLGLAKLVGRDFSSVLTTMRRTMGYLAPEWLSGDPITPKADVYAFGVMLSEIISGNRNVVFRDDGDFFFLPIWAAKRTTS